MEINTRWGDATRLQRRRRRYRFIALVSANTRLTRMPQALCNALRHHFARHLLKPISGDRQRVLITSSYYPVGVMVLPSVMFLDAKLDAFVFRWREVFDRVQLQRLIDWSFIRNVHDSLQRKDPIQAYSLCIDVLKDF